MNANRIQAQYARHPKTSLELLAKRLAKKKWHIEDIVREDESHKEEFGETGNDKEYIDRYIIANIAEQYNRKARLKQQILRDIWESKHKNESFDENLPRRMARFRQYEDIPFSNNDVAPDKKTPGLLNAKWDKYLKTASFIEKIRKSQ